MPTHTKKRVTLTANDKRPIRPQGTVDIWYIGLPPMRFRKLIRIDADGVEIPNDSIIIYGYSAFPPNRGPWFGWSRELIGGVPCHHCEKLDIFNREDWTHQCPGGKGETNLPCLNPHLCEGKPKMNGCNTYHYKEWKEVHFDED